MFFANGETVYRLRAQCAANPYSGEPDMPSWDAPSRLAIPGCAVDTGNTAEAAIVERATANQQAILLCPYGSDIEPDDRIEDSRGRLWLVAGLRTDERNPFTGWEAGSTVPLKRIEVI